MFYPNPATRFCVPCPCSRMTIKELLFFTFVFCAFSGSAFAQTLDRNLSTSETPEITVKNRNGRVVIKAVDGQKTGASIMASSPGAPVSPSDVIATSNSGRVGIDVRARSESDRIDLTVLVPERSRVKVESEDGAVDVIGNLAEAQVVTNTGTIRADVPTDAVRYDFLWQAIRPRYFSDVELQKIKEKAGGLYV